ncbi:hypothetical protein MPLA_720067 [Mesorhizobium sp. ORS 3359]|nr:hypothetical protein MPLA_720067 [Mesorhizobium sp. ORS 3359]
MPETIPILIGEVTVDFTMPTPCADAKVRLGGVVHAARGLWASGRDYVVGAFCPAYLVEQARSYLTLHGCKEFILLGEVTGAPNVIAIRDVREVGHQGYEDILRDQRSVVLRTDHVDLKRFDTVIIFPGSYDLGGVLNQLGSGARVTIDAAYDVDSADFISSLRGRVDSVVISTSSSLFAEVASSDVAPLLDLAKCVGARQLLLKENRGGSRLFDLGTGDIEHITATLDVTSNSVGVGDVFTAVFGSFDGSAPDAAWRGMQVATVYSQTTWPDDLRRDVERELRMPLEIVRELGGVTLPWHVRPGLQIYLAAPDFSYRDHKEISTAVAALEYHNFRVRRPVKETGTATDFRLLVRSQGRESYPSIVVSVCGLVTLASASETCLPLPEKPRQNIRPYLPGPQSNPVLESVQRHTVEAVMREQRHQRVAVEVVQVLVGEAHAPGSEPGVAVGAELAPAAIRDGYGEVPGLQAAEETQVRDVLEHVEHGDEIPRTGERLLPIDKADTLGQRKLGDVAAGAIGDACYLRGFDECAGAVSDFEHGARNLAGDPQHPAKPLIAELDGPVAQVLVVGDVFLVVLDRREVDLVDHAKPVHLVIVQHCPVALRSPDCDMAELNAA